jgi:hypothetical protein
MFIEPEATQSVPSASGTPRSVEDGGLGGVAVEDDVGARGPDDAGLLGVEQLGVVGAEGDRVDDRGHRLDDVVGGHGQAHELVAGEALLMPSAMCGR